MGKLMVGVARILPLCAVVLLLPAPAASQSTTQPSPGWYKNSGPSNISQVSPWRVSWQNSYIYQHPGTDNLYWYAQVEFYNVSTQNQNFVCNGVGCPSCIKEHIKRGGAYLGFVTAEDTFCMRNPNFVTPVKPGEAFNDWVIFHNVPWKGDEVSLEWGSYGASAYVNPWSSPLSALTPAECPPELVKLGTCQPKIPAGQAPNLIVLVHGCCTDTNDVIKDWESFGRLVAGTMPIPATWEIVVWDWSKDTIKGPQGPDVAIEKAIDQSLKLSLDIAQHTYEHIHLIGHSAGSRLIHLAAKRLVEYYNTKNETERPFIHLTFLDAYTPFNAGKDEYGDLGSYSHYAEHYVDRGHPFNVFPYTDACLTNAFNFDITGWQPVTSDELAGGGHQWPIYWYKKSVKSTQAITYSGPFTNTNFNSHGTVVIDFNMETGNSVSGYINFTGDPGQTLCGAEDFTGTIQGNSIDFSFISRDPDPGCGFDWGWYFTVRGTLSDSGRVFTGNYSINNGQQGIFQSTVIPKIKYGYTLSREGGNGRFNTLAVDYRPRQQCPLGDVNTNCQQATCW